MSTPDTPLYSILRIKRKRTTSQLPLDALVIDDPAPSSKRRRHHVPAVESGQSRGIFRFAETVPLDSFDNVAKTRQLKDRIAAFLHRPPPAALSRVSSTGSLPSHSPTSSSPSTRKPSSLRSRTAATGPDSPQEQRLQNRVKGFHEESKRARYKIVQRQRSTIEGLGLALRSPREEMAAGARGTARPPVVMAAADLARASAAASDRTRIYDAEEELLPSARHANILPATESCEKDQEMTAQFASMLEEYLTLQDSEPFSRADSDLPVSSLPDPDNLADSDDDFVYDVYYRDLRDGASDRALAGLGGTSADVASLAGLRRVGELAGLEDDEILDNGAALSDEEEDEDDQDSNEENDYRNDYPEDEEEEDSDEELEQWSD